MNELIQMVFATRNAVHIEHWRTKSFSQHMALGDLYDELIEGIDALVECYQGAFGLVSPTPKDEKIGDIIVRLEDDLLFISKNRSKITQGLPALDNILQELEGNYLRAIYKLKNLA